MASVKNGFFLLILMIVGCKEPPKTLIAPWVAYDESAEIEKNAEHDSERMRYKLIQSKVLDKNDIWENVSPQIAYFTEAEYQRLAPLIFNQDIPSIQAHIRAGDLTYELLTQWYLYRIVKFENNPELTLHAIININSYAVAAAQACDKNKSDMDHPIYGMPILLKDNINLEGLPTTAGTHVFRNNHTEDAFIVERIKEHGGIILGKANLSEWANFLCLGCPNGYSAVGGQTLNPYGRKVFDTGGSSSGSGASMAANYAAAAVGTETSGSILSPASKHSLVGLKPTVGLLSRSGIVPISSTLDTPGPMTRSVIDNAILLDAMRGTDPADPAMKNVPKDHGYWNLEGSDLKGLRFGVNINFLEDSIYQLTVDKIVALGAIAVEFEPEQMNFENFGTLLSADMKIDLPQYINEYGSADISYRNVSEIVTYNQQDSLVRIPYGQERFARMLEVELSVDEHDEIKNTLHQAGVNWFETPFNTHQLDAILSINNWNAGQAAAAKYPCITLPMGYSETGEPTGLTFIARPFEESKLLKMAYAFEQATRIRKYPKDFN